VNSIVFLPGMDGSGSLFQSFVSALGPGVQPTVVSYPPDEGLGYSGLESLVRRALPSEPYAIVAESFSGPLALKLAADRTPGLQALVLSCTFARSPHWAPKWLHGALSRAPLWHAPPVFVRRALLGSRAQPELQLALAQAISRVAPIAWRARLRAVLETDVTDRLPHIRVPVLYLRATNDKVVPKSAAGLICELVPHARLVEIDSPHFMLQTRAREAAIPVVAFLREVGFAL
jgi:pimeloyl-ACP methyl ester carboxylesterase